MKITVDRTVIEHALEALEEAENVLTWDGFQRAADALRVALGQQYMTNAKGELEPVTVVQTGVGIGKPEQEPVATVTSETGADISMSWWHEPALRVGTKLYTAPPQRKPLTEKEIETYRHMIDWTASWSYINFARAIEAAHGIREEV